MRVMSHHPGRPQRTSRDEIEATAFALFRDHGFEAVTVAHIADAANIGRRTFFRYFPSKNDVVWGDWDRALAEFAARLAAADAHRSLATVLRQAVVEYNTVPAAAAAQHRLRMELILHVPVLQAHSTLRYAQWRHVVAGYVGRRLSTDPSSLTPQVIAAATLGAATSAYELWLRQSTAGPAVLTELLDAAMCTLTRWQEAPAIAAGDR